MIDFDKALEATEGTTRNLLLGNGFSRDLGEQVFAYKALFESSQFGYPLRGIFEYFGTFDFEKVMKSLEDTKRIMSFYNLSDHPIQLKIKKEIKSLKEYLIKVISEKHPESIHSIDGKSCHCSGFLSNFIPDAEKIGKIFTLNYDLLLYWVLMRDKKCSNPRLRFDDGFRRGEGNLLKWELFCDQNINYLHGALHIYDDDVGIKKIKYSEDNQLIIQIKNNIENNHFPMVVSEGMSVKKLEKIQHNPYLYNAFNTFSESMNEENHPFFIFGFSFNDTDQHIIEIMKNGRVNNFFVSVHEDPDGEFQSKVLKCLRGGKNKPEITFFRAQSAHVWS